LLTVSVRYKEPREDASKLLSQSVRDDGRPYSVASADFRFAAAVAGFGMLLRDSPEKGTLTWDLVLGLARSGTGPDLAGHRAEFVRLAETAAALAVRGGRRDEGE
jgi:Ca-activated chloride channel family protein